MAALTEIRDRIRELRNTDEGACLRALEAVWAPDRAQRTRITRRAEVLIEALRRDTTPSLMEAFLAEYGLSTEEGVALMCLAEALLRVPDTATIDDLIEDKIAPSTWSEHLGNSSSPLVNASTWGLLFVGKVLNEKQSGNVAMTLHRLTKRLGEPIIRAAVNQAMKELGRQFVLGETTEKALRRGEKNEERGYTHSYDMLGEAAITTPDADAYFESYRDAIASLKSSDSQGSIRQRPGISIKLSALHPRYDALQHERVITELVPRAAELVLAAKEANIGLNIDAEENNRLDISLDVIESLLRDPTLEGWDGFGVVVQAYAKQAPAVIDWLDALSEELGRRIMVRLVKGAYWDSEIKEAQVDGAHSFPVFTQKAATDVSYICCARKLLSMRERIYPQFATHNAHTVAAILEEGVPHEAFEFQRLHGMGEALYELLRETEGTACRIYAPVGSHRDLLAYLVRRLLENGANSSFVNQVIDEALSTTEIAADPFARVAASYEADHKKPTLIAEPSDLYAPGRINSRGWDLRDPTDHAAFVAARAPFETAQWHASSLLADTASGAVRLDCFNPAQRSDQIGTTLDASDEDAQRAIEAARPWQAKANERAQALRAAASLYEAHHGEFFALLTREAGKSALDAIAELREAVDFLRYYAEQASDEQTPRGVFTCISPWNFPLAIFTGQIAAALVAGNGVLAKPAESTPLIAWRAVQLLHEAGVPRETLQLVLGEGHKIGAALTANARIDGVCFTGSTETAQRINRAMADTLAPGAPLIAETGGINAMIVDSTALPEQAVGDVIESAFQSAGQRCSALRVLYLQKDIADSFMQMLFHAMEELRVGNPWDLATDLGPVIDTRAQSTISEYVEAARREGRLLKQLSLDVTNGFFIAPAVIAISGIQDVQKEIFGPVLHIATFDAADLSKVVGDINGQGFGLTFGIHSRIDDRVELVSSAIRAGNIYVNRNQIGAVVESQPFGGEGLSGTGPKAGGPNYVPRFCHSADAVGSATVSESINAAVVQNALNALPPTTAETLYTNHMPGPTGESNLYYTVPRGRILCLGPGAEEAQRQADQAREMGCEALIVAPGAVGNGAIAGHLDRSVLATLTGFAGVALWSDEDDRRAARQALAQRDGVLLPLFTEADFRQRCVLERHRCINTTAAGGNATLLELSS